jgi:hypothetical protein
MSDDEEDDASWNTPEVVAKKEEWEVGKSFHDFGLFQTWKSSEGSSWKIANHSNNTITNDHVTAKGTPLYVSYNYACTSHEKCQGKVV